jgi:hypothetical protein
MYVLYSRGKVILGQSGREADSGRTQQQQLDLKEGRVSGMKEKKKIRDCRAKI